LVNVNFANLHKPQQPPWLKVKRPKPLKSPSKKVGKLLANATFKYEMRQRGKAPRKGFDAKNTHTQSEKIGSDGRKIGFSNFDAE